MYLYYTFILSLDKSNILIRVVVKNNQPGTPKLFSIIKYLSSFTFLFGIIQSVCAFIFFLFFHFFILSRFVCFIFNRNFRSKFLFASCIAESTFYYFPVLFCCCCCCSLFCVKLFTFNNLTRYIQNGRRDKWMNERWNDGWLCKGGWQ